MFLCKLNSQEATLAMDIETIRPIVDRVLRERLLSMGYESSEVAEDFDHDGDPVLTIRVHYAKVGDTVDPTPTFSVVRHLREALETVGERRFPHLRHLFPEDQELKVA